MGEVPEAADGTQVEALQSETQLRFVEQEHRLFHAIANVVRYRKGPEDFRRGAILALGWALTSRFGRAATTGGVGLVALLGLVIAWRANALLEQQNHRIDQQTLLIDAQRRSSLNIELSGISDQLNAEAPRTAPTRAIPLSNVLVSRIVAVSRALSPYQALDLRNAPKPAGQVERGTWARLVGVAEPKYIPFRERPLSPERGQLLQALAAIGADLESISERGATFAYADLEAQVLSFPNASSLDLTRANLKGAVLWRTDFTNANLTQAEFACAHFEHVTFGFSSGVNETSGINFRDTNPGVFTIDYQSRVGGNHMHPAIFAESNLEGAFLSGLSFDRQMVEAGLRLPPSFDRSRYMLVTDEMAGLEVKARDQVKEQQLLDAMVQRCETVAPAIDTRKARVIWGDMLKDEWPGF